MLKGSLSGLAMRFVTLNVQYRHHISVTPSLHSISVSMMSRVILNIRQQTGTPNSIVSLTDIEICDPSSHTSSLLTAGSDIIIIGHQSICADHLEEEVVRH